MNVQSTKQKVVLAIVVVVIIVAVIYAVTRNSGQQVNEPAPLTPEQKQEVINSLQPATPSTNKELTPEQKKALNTLGTNGTTTYTQSSNTPSQEKSLLDSLQ